MATRREASSSGGMSEFQDETENWRDSTVASQLLAPKQGHMMSTSSIQSSQVNLALLQTELIAPDLYTHEAQAIVPRTHNNLDKGYAWVVLAACLFLQVIPNLPLVTSGIFYIEYIREFERGEAATSWIGSLQSAIVMLVSPAIAVIVDKTSDRASCMIGSAGTAFILVAISFVNQFEVLLFLSGILQPMFMCMTYIPSAVFVSNYFLKRRTLALCIVPSSAALVFLFIPWLTVWMIESFGWRITSVAFACLAMQGVVCGALLFPVESLPEVISEPTSESKKDSFSYDLTEVPPERSYCASTGNLQLGTARPLLLTNSLSAIKEDITWEQEQPAQPTVIEQSNLCGDYFSMSTLLFYLNGFCWGWGASTFFILTTDYMKAESGLGTDEISMLLIGFGVSGFAIRISLAVIGNLVSFDKLILTSGAHLLMAISLAGFVLFSTKAMYGVLLCLYAIGYGAITSLTGPVIIKLMGVERIAVYLSLNVFCYGTGCLLSAPFTGFMLEKFGSYAIGFSVSSAICGIGALTYLPIIIKARLSPRDQQE